MVWFIFAIVATAVVTWSVCRGRAPTVPALQPRPEGVHCLLCDAPLRPTTTTSDQVVSELERRIGGKNGAPAPAPAPLHSSELFAGLTDTQRGRLDALTVERRVKAGAVLLELGQQADEIFVVGTGLVELTLPLRVMRELKEVRCEVLGPGRALAWSALVPPHRCSVGARAATDGTLLSLSRDRLLALFDEEPRIGLTMMTNLARVVGSRLIETQGQWMRELQQDVGGRYG